MRASSLVPEFVAPQVARPLTEAERTMRRFKCLQESSPRIITSASRVAIAGFNDQDFSTFSKLANPDEQDKFLLGKWFGTEDANSAAEHSAARALQAVDRLLDGSRTEPIQRSFALLGHKEIYQAYAWGVETDFRNGLQKIVQREFQSKLPLQTLERDQPVDTLQFDWSTSAAHIGTLSVVNTLKVYEAPDPSWETNHVVDEHIGVPHTSNYTINISPTD